MGDYRPFDPDWWAIGCLEPEFVEEVVGYANEELVIDSGDFEAAYVLTSGVPRYIPRVTRPLVEPVPIVRKSLRWRWVGM